MLRNTRASSNLLIAGMLFVCIMSMPGAARAESVVLQPGPEGKDAGVCSMFGWNGTNFGSIEWYYAIGLVSSAAAFIEFDLSSIPEGATIDSATITLWAEFRDGQIFFRPVVAAWDEMTITWDNQPSIYVPEISHPITACYSGCTQEFDITGIAQYWMGNPNYGLRVVADSPNIGWLMASSDNLTRQRPMLTVEYTLVGVVGTSWGAIKSLYE